MLFPPYSERFWAKVDKTGECWLWLGGIDLQGYGSFTIANGPYRGTFRASRFAYLDNGGVIPEGLVIDHVWARGCRHRHCVNPGHLEPVTNRENIVRGWASRGGRMPRCSDHGAYSGPFCPRCPGLARVPRVAAS